MSIVHQDDSNDMASICAGPFLKAKFPYRLIIFFFFFFFAFFFFFFFWFIFYFLFFILFYFFFFFFWLLNLRVQGKTPKHIHLLNLLK